MPFLLAFLALVGVITVPLLQLAAVTLRANSSVSDKGAENEAAKAGLRVALADPVELYKYCDSAGLTVGRTLASPGLTTPVTSTCYKVAETQAEDPTELRYGLALTKSGATVPNGTAGSVFPGSGDADAVAWQALATVDPEFEHIWMPNLPTHSLDRRGVSGYEMDSSAPNCTVYFPGTYPDDVIIRERVYFASGVYYFEGKLEFRDGADAVVGGGTETGCTTDQDAAFYALNPPSRHNISGLGATFVFGDQGRFVVHNHHGPDPVSVRFNQRYVAEEDVANLPTAGVSIMTVNGRLDGTAGVDLVVGEDLHVPLSQVGSAGSPADPIAQEYQPSVITFEDPNAPILPTDAGYDPTLQLTVADPVIEITPRLVGASTTVDIPGYISVPQGLVDIGVRGGHHDISVTGGILAADLELSTWLGGSADVGLINPVVQKIFLIVSETMTGEGTEARSEAVVQINESGAYAINSWEVQ